MNLRKKAVRNDRLRSCTFQAPRDFLFLLKFEALKEGKLFKQFLCEVLVDGLKARDIRIEGRVCKTSLKLLSQGGEDQDDKQD